MSVGNSEPNTDSSTQSVRWKECLGVAIRYYHGHLDTTIQNNPEGYTTARDYFSDRGWTNETIESHLLGYAPAKAENGLITHLRKAGFRDEEILATGLVTKSLSPLWFGRYVLPYMDADGEPVYAISRKIGSGEDVGHPDDFLKGKYAKLAHGKDYVPFNEPIFGLETVRENEAVLITEGIADAITVQQAGYPCVSPVTTQFSENNRNDLLKTIEDCQIPRVYIIQDAEYPSSRYDEESEQIELDKSGYGIEGARQTATFLIANGVDAQVNTPPQPDARKVDLHDYVQEEWGTIGALLRSAKPPNPSDEDGSVAQISESGTVPEYTESEKGKKSGLRQLDITDVTGLRIGYRGRNPLSHTGSREDYFVIEKAKRTNLAYDHKRKVTYNALTYLLCEAGTRSPNSPGGPLSDEEMFVAWKHAKESGYLPDDDPIPHKAIKHIAITHDFCDADEILDGWRIPPQAYNGALGWVLAEHGLDPAREPLGSQPVAEQSESVTATQDVPEISLEDARDRCKETIYRALEDSQFSLIDALPAQGKSRGVIEWAANTGTPLTILAPRRELLKEDYVSWCEEFGLDYYLLPAFHRDCGCMTGEHGQEWRNKVSALYEADVPAVLIHELGEDRFGEPLPCQIEGDCPYIAKRNVDLERFDVLLGHYTHANVCELVEDRFVVLDESPYGAFLHHFEHPEVATAVSHYLQSHDGLPFDNYTDLTENRSDPYRKEDALAWFQQENEDVYADRLASVMFDTTGKAHTLAPLMTYSLLAGEDLGNEWEHITLPGNRSVARDRNPAQHVKNPDPELSILIPPEFEGALGVVGLDGTPSLPQWELCLGGSVDHYPVLTQRERAGYLRHALRYDIWQMCESSRPYSSGHHVRLEEDALFLKQIGEWERRLPDVISSKKAFDQYENATMELIGEHEHYGNLKGTNKFSQTRVAVVLGSPHYGDKYLERWGALAGERIERQNKGMDLDYGDFGNQILRTMREGEVLQALMRFGRDGEGATVYVVTGALPEWVRTQVLTGTGKLQAWSAGTRGVLAVIGDRDQFVTADLVESRGKDRVLRTVEHGSLTERSVLRNLKTLERYGFLTRKDRKRGNGHLWIDNGLDQVQEGQQVVRSPCVAE